MERRIQSWFAKSGPGFLPYHKEYIPVPLSRIAPDLQHAVVSAEDARFYKHNGFDWTEIEQAANNDLEGRRLRGASTITQQLVKNLFLTTSRTAIRKAVEITIVPLAEAILGKQRILELYLNVIEWGPVFMERRPLRAITTGPRRFALPGRKLPGLAAIIQHPDTASPQQ